MYYFNIAFYDMSSVSCTIQLHIVQHLGPTGGVPEQTKMIYDDKYQV